jgi:hypothetical protein
LELGLKMIEKMKKSQGGCRNKEITNIWKNLNLHESHSTTNLYFSFLANALKINTNVASIHLKNVQQWKVESTIFDFTIQTTNEAKNKNPLDIQEQKLSSHQNVFANKCPTQNENKLQKIVKCQIEVEEKYIQCFSRTKMTLG